MKTFFYRPKYTIYNILFLIGLLSLFMSFLALGTVILWKYYPKTIDEIERLIPDLYGNNIKSLYKSAQESENKEEEFKNYFQLYSELENVSRLNKYYNYRRISAKYLISYYLVHKQNNKAFKIAEKWERNYPNDFDGKFVYIDVSSKIDRNISNTYIKNLYNKHSDIQEVKDLYVTYLLEHNDYNKALRVSKSNDILNQKYADFQVFYIDNTKSFSGKQSIVYSKNNFNFSQGVYSLSLNKKFTNFKGLRIDIDSIANGTSISKISLTINRKKIDIENLNDLENIKDNQYKKIGIDPYFVFNIPKQFQNYSGILNISFSCEILRYNSINKILQNGEWQFFANTGKGFNEKESIQFKLKNGDKFTSNTIVDFKDSSNIRLDFPFIKGLYIDDFEIIINNDKTAYSKKDIISANGIKRTEKYLAIDNNDPFVIINLREKTDIKNLKIQVIFNGAKDE